MSTKPLDVGRYADLLAVLHHYRAEPMSEVLTSLAIDDALWNTTDAYWTEELALCASRRQESVAFTFSTRYAKMRRRLARQGLGVDLATGKIKSDYERTNSDAGIPLDANSTNEKTTLRPAMVETPLAREPAIPLPRVNSDEGMPQSHSLSRSPWVNPNRVSPVVPLPVHAPALVPGTRLDAVDVYSTGALHAAAEHAQAAEEARIDRGAPLGATLPVEDQSIAAIARKIMPFHSADASRSGGDGDLANTRPPTLTIEQHASLHVDLGLNPENRPAILQRYGLDAEKYAQFDATWKARVAREPDLAKVWEQAVILYRTWLVGRQFR